MAVDGARSSSSLNTAKIQSHLNKVSPQRLLKNARQLDQQQQQQQQEFEITGDYSVKFNECLTLNVLNDEEEQDQDQQDGNNDVYHATSIKDYVIVDVISSYDGSVKQYAVDLVTFVTTLANYIPEQMEGYCEACDYDYCYNNNGDDNNNENQNDENQEGEEEEDREDNEEEEDKENEEEDGGRRRLKNNGKIVYTDCETCSNMNCFQDENNNQDGENVYSNENALEWLMDVGECQEIDEEYYNYYDENGYQLYAGYTCNSDGSGMEIGVFADEECSILTTTTFAEVVENGGYGSSYQSMSSGLVHRVFQQYFDCMNTEYINPGEDQQEEDEEENEDEDAQFEANEFCQQLVQDDAIAMDESCMEDNNNGENQNNYQYDEWGNPYGQYTDANGDIIYYDVQKEDDAEEVCVAIQGKEGDYTTALEHGSSLYDYSNSKNIDNDSQWDWDSGKEGQNDKISGNSGQSGNNLWSKTKNKVHSMANKYGFSAAEMWAIVAAAFLFGILLLLLAMKVCCGRGKKKGKINLDDSDDAVTRSRREPLVNNPEVYVA